MGASPVKRRLAAILAADVAGYSRLVAEDEEGTLRTLGAYRGTIAGLIAEHGGRIFGTAGDSVVAEFASAVQAVRAAVAIQRALQRRNADLPQARRMEFRIGINLGDVIAEGDDLYGDGVIIAARLQQEVAVPAGICLSGAVREQIEGKLTFPLAPLGERSLKNLPRPVPVYRVEWGVDAPTATGVLGGGAPALPDKPSIAVLPFVNLSGDPEQEYFADGITEDIITALSHYRWLFVIARNSTFAYKGRPAVDVKQVARELGVRYVLQGSVRKAGNRIGASAQLVEAESGNHLWAEGFDRDLADIFTLQDEITQSVVGAIEPEMLLVEGRRAARKVAAANLDAFDCCLRGLWHFHQFALDDNRQAETWLRRSIALDPNLAQARMGLARAQHPDLVGMEPRHRTRFVRSLCSGDPCRCARRSRSLHALRDVARQHADAPARAGPGRGAACHRPQSQLCPRLFWARLDPHLHRAFRRSDRSDAAQPPPQSERPSCGSISRPGGTRVLSPGQLRGGRPLCGARAAQSPVTFLLRTLLASLGQLGRTEEARAVLAELERFQPADAERYWETISPYADPAHLAHLVEGLRKAGMQVQGAAPEHLEPR